MTTKGIFGPGWSWIWWLFIIGLFFLFFWWICGGIGYGCGYGGYY